MKHYRLDKADARRRTERDPKREQAEAAELGFYTYGVLAIVPIGDIIHAEVWQPGRFERASEAVAKGVPLPAIQVDKVGSKYTIGDGIHRYNASLAAGMTHIPVIYTVVVEAPEMFVQAEPEKPRLPVGAWVRLREPSKHNAEPWARIDEQLTSRIMKGVRRYVYGLVGVVRGEPEFLGDFFDTEFDPAPHPPSSIEKAIGRWLTAKRVAARFLVPRS